MISKKKFEKLGYIRCGRYKTEDGMIDFEEYQKQMIISTIKIMFNKVNLEITGCLTNICDIENLENLKNLKNDFETLNNDLEKLKMGV